MNDVRPFPPPAPGRSSLVENQRLVLERITANAGLEQIFEALVRLIEEQTGDMRCAVLLADPGQTRLRFIAAPNIPENYRLGIEPFLEIAPRMGSCGTAAFLRRPVYTRDTASDPLWENCGEIAVRNGLRAIWSTPILSGYRVLGSFAMYYGEPRLPSEAHIQLIDMATQLARLAIETRSDDALLRLLFEDSPRGIVICDVAGNINRVNRSFAEMLGYAPDELPNKHVRTIMREDDYDRLVQSMLSGSAGEQAAPLTYQRKDGAPLKVRQSSRLQRDTSGRARWVFGRVEHRALGQDLLVRLSRREAQVLQFVVVGHTSREIGARLRISPASVATYRSRIMEKLGVSHLPGLIQFALLHGLLSDSTESAPDDSGKLATLAHTKLRPVKGCE